MAGSSLYAYGVVEREDVEFETEGVNGAGRAYTVEYRTLSALVTDVDTVEPERTDENARAHNEVLQQLLEYDGGRTVVPMGFGMAFRDAGTLKNVLRETRPAFSRALREVDGRVELGLKVLADGDGAVDEAAMEEAVTDRFDPLAASVTDDELFSDRLVVNRSFLVDRENREAFDAAVGEFDDEHDEHLVQYTGPWAPYNFVDVEVGAKR